MTALATGPPGTAMVQFHDRLITVNRSDGFVWTTDDIRARLAKDRVARQIGEPIPEVPNLVPDEDMRKTLELWQVVVARGLMEELGWPRGCQYQLKFPDGFCLRECTPLGAGWSSPSPKPLCAPRRVQESSS